jgi:ribosomal protein S18 acetylase RimI-like enzyme
MLDVRLFQEEDRGAVVQLWNDVFRNPPPWNDPEADISRKLLVQPDLFFVATDREKLAGTALAGFDGHRGWVYYLAVQPQQRRQGVGRALMAAVESALAARGCHKMNLQVRSTGRDAVAFYERLGYSVEDHISMGKLLDPA